MLDSANGGVFERLYIDPLTRVRTFCLPLHCLGMRVHECVYVYTPILLFSFNRDWLCSSDLTLSSGDWMVRNMDGRELGSTPVVQLTTLGQPSWNLAKIEGVIVRPHRAAFQLSCFLSLSYCSCWLATRYARTLWLFSPFSFLIGSS